MAESSFNERLKTLIKKRGLTQRETATRAGVTECALSHYVAGDRTPNSSTLINLADALGTSPDYLLSGEPFTENEKLDAAVDTVKRLSAYLSYEQKMGIVESLFDKE